ncbi:MAG: apolipoprotein N-acyltransferase [Deferrisomatales bacterium]|nr:apolipoprotein N-acyltransferase [Deferrisomatales bacterium]
MGATASRWRDPGLWLLAAWGALVAALGFPPAGVWPMALLAPAPLWAAAVPSAPRQAAARGFAFGLGFYLSLIWWIVPTVVRYGGLPWVAGAACLVCLAAALAVYPAVVAAVCGWVGTRRPAGALLLAPLLWSGAEWARGVVFSGFPWGDLPQALWQVQPALDLAPWVGIEGVRLLVAGLAVAPAWLLLRLGGRRCSPLALVPAVLAAGCAVGLWLVPQPDTGPGTRIGVGVAQGNIDQARKWDPEYRRETLERYAQLSRRAMGDGTAGSPALLVWPETAMPFYAQDPGPLPGRVAELARELGVAVVFGAPAYERSADGVEYRNAVFLQGADGRRGGRYDKVHLVPFGEYVPLGRYLPFVKKLVQGAGDFTPGPEMLLLGGGGDVPRLGPLVCFEVIFPALARSHARRGTQLLTVVTNDGWFGHTPGPYQHLAFAAWRAAENRLPLVRAANTGVSAAFDRRGRLLHATELGTAAAFRVELDLPSGPPPPSVWLGPWLGPGCLVLAALGVFAILPALRRAPPELSETTP